MIQSIKSLQRTLYRKILFFLHSGSMWCLKLNHYIYVFWYIRIMRIAFVDTNCFPKGPKTFFPHFWWVRRLEDDWYVSRLSNALLVRHWSRVQVYPIQVYIFRVLILFRITADWTCSPSTSDTTTSIMTFPSFRRPHFHNSERSRLNFTKKFHRLTRLDNHSDRIMHVSPDDNFLSYS